MTCRRLVLSFSILAAAFALFPSVYAQTAGYAISFDGADDFLDYGANPILNFALTDSFTYECWVNVPSTELQGTFLSQRKSGDSWPVIDLGIGLGLDPGAVIWQIRGDGGNPPSQVFSTTQINDGIWHHIAAVRDAGTRTLRLYIDGTLEAEGPEDLVVGITTNLRTIGNERFWTLQGFLTPDEQFFNGLVDELKIWRVARTEAEIQASMHLPLTGSESGLLGYWRYDEGAGQISADLTGNGNTATLGNSSAIDAADPDWIPLPDNDVDGVQDGIDNCPDEPNPDQADSDGDGVGDACDNCLDIPNSAQTDTDGDSFGSACDCDDSVGVTYPNAPQLCDGANNDCNDPAWPDVPTEELDVDLDGYSLCEGDCDDSNAAVSPGVAEVCNGIDDDCNGLVDDDDAGADSDADLVANLCDNCPAESNVDQADVDADGIGDVCDTCPDVSDPDQSDSDGDGCGDLCELAPATIRFTPRTLNLRSQGMHVQAKVDLGPWIDEAEIDPSRAIELSIAGSPPILDQSRNLDEGGLSVKFSRSEAQALAPVAESVEFRVTGWIIGGCDFEGVDYVRVIDQGASHTYEADSSSILDDVQRGYVQNLGQTVPTECLVNYLTNHGLMLNTDLEDPLPGEAFFYLFGPCPTP